MFLTQIQLNPIIMDKPQLTQLPNYQNYQNVSRPKNFHFCSFFLSLCLISLSNFPEKIQPALTESDFANSPERSMEQVV